MMCLAEAYNNAVVAYNRGASARQNQQMACAPSENSDQPGHPLSDQNLCCPHEESLDSQLPVKRTTKTLID